MITQVLHNIILREDILTKRIDYILKSMQSSDYVGVVTTLEERLKDIIKNTGKNKFTEEDIEIILCNILQLEVRDYDKSHLVRLDKGEITSVKPYPQKTKSKTYGDVTLTKIGRLIYKEWNGVKNYVGLPYFKVEKKDEDGKVQTYKVFSHIDFEMMENDSDYKQAVLDVLLDEKNITKTNCGGYIGSIKPYEEGRDLEDTVKANSNYSLVFNSKEATAVAMLRNQVKQKYTHEKNNEEGR